MYTSDDLTKTSFKFMWLLLDREELRPTEGAVSKLAYYAALEGELYSPEVLRKQ